MSKRWFGLLLALLLVVGACGDDDDTADTTAAPGTSEAPGTTEAMADVEIRWRTRPDNDTEAGVYRTVSETLTGSLDGITLTYEAGGTETEGYQQALLTQLAGGTAPDVFWIPGADIAEFATKGVILDIRQYVGGKQKRLPRLTPTFRLFPEAKGGFRIEVGRGLIEHHQRDIGHSRNGERQSLAHASR